MMKKKKDEDAKPIEQEPAALFAPQRLRCIFLPVDGPTRHGNRIVCPSACLEELIISLLAPCSGSLPWNPFTVAISACLRIKATNQLLLPVDVAPEPAAVAARTSVSRSPRRRSDHIYIYIYSYIYIYIYIERDMYHIMLCYIMLCYITSDYMIL